MTKIQEKIEKITYYSFEDSHDVDFDDMPTLMPKLILKMIQLLGAKVKVLSYVINGSFGAQDHFFQKPGY